MKHLTILLFCGVLMKGSFSQSNHLGLHFGKYEGVEIKYLKHVSDTSSKVDRMNERWGKKTLTIDSNGTFSLEFPVPYPTTTVEPNRLTTGKWIKKKDTLILNSFRPYSNFIKVNERKVKDKRIRVKVSYTYKGEKYYPPLSVRINRQDEQMIDTKGKQWAYFPLDTVKRITIEHWVSPTSTNREWLYRPLNSNSNSFEIIVTDNGDRNNFVVEDYKLLIVGSSLLQIDQLFRLQENRFKATNFR